MIFDFFFQDFAGKNKAPESFIVDVLTHLDSRLYTQGEVIFAENAKVDDLVVVASGKLNLFGFYEHRG